MPSGTDTAASLHRRALLALARHGLGGFELALLVVTAAIFTGVAGIARWGAWYSADFAHRLQTEAFFRGTFALQPVPYGQRADWAWGDGSQQVWGLAVPFLRMPLEAVGRAVGGIGFPDRVTFVLAVIAAAAVLLSAIGDRPVPFESDTGTRRVPSHTPLPVPRWQRAAVLLAMLFCPAFVTICRTRFRVYEEAVAYGYLWAVVLVALLLGFWRDGGARRLAWLCVAAGASVIFRPTAALTGVATMAVAVVVARRGGMSVRAMTAPVALFALGPLAAMAIDVARFGDAFEVGQRLNVSHIPLDQFAKSFGYPFAHEPIGSAASELLSSLFRVDHGNGHGFYQAAIHPGQSTTLRFREFYFQTFDRATAAILVLTWAGVLVATIGARARASWAAAARGSGAGLLAAWSATAFALQFAFYLRMPSMTSRYTLDFAPAVAAATAAFLLLSFRLAGRLRVGVPRMALRIATMICVGWLARAAATGWVSPTHAPAPLLTAAEVETRLPRPATSGPPLPEAYQCGEDPARFGIPFNTSGWAMAGDCTVLAATMLYLPEPACVALDLAPLPGQGPLRAEQIDVVRAKFGIVALDRVGDQTTSAGRTLTFCRPRGARRNPRGIELVYVGFVEPTALAPDMRPMRLLAVRKVSPGDMR